MGETNGAGAAVAVPAGAAPQGRERQGFYITGSLVAVKAGREYTTRAGEIRTPGLVVLLVGEATYKVEYPTVADAQAAVEAIAPMETCTLAVFVRGSWNPEARRRGPVSLSGVTGREG